MALASSNLLSSQSWSSALLQGSPSQSSRVSRGVVRVTCKKKDIHPKYYHKASVYCNGQQVMVTGGTQPEYVVDIWSGNHPFYRGEKSAVLLDADRVEQFKRRYGESSIFSQIPVLTKGEIVIEKKKSGPGKGKGKK
uniref:50S ribosomal protein L31 n=1 Tax=Wollemia nobilis TaxID=56998 RepID=A0A0C9RFR8_9CONI